MLIFFLNRVGKFIKFCINPVNDVEFRLKEFKLDFFKSIF